MSGFSRFGESVVCLLLVLVCSCSAPDAGTRQASNPASPDLPALTQEKGHSADSEWGTDPAGHYLWGFYWIACDPEKNAIEVIPSRQVSAHWNVLKWLEQGPCLNCVSIPHMENSDHGSKLMDVKIKHPFSSANLTGFDVRGIALFHGSFTFPTAGLTTPDRWSGDGELLNSDGYTTLYNSSTVGSGPGGLQGYLKGKFATVTAPDAELNGYKRFMLIDPANTRNIFYAGEELTRLYDIDMPDSVFVFGYAVDANWAPPINKPVEDPDTDFGPEANCPEPYRIDAEEQPIGPGLTTDGGSTKIMLDIYDYQGVDSHKAPKVESPEIFDGELTATFKDDIPYGSHWEVTVSNDNHAQAGFYRMLISVEDNANDTAPAWLDLTAYQMMFLKVSIPGDEPPIAMAIADPPAQAPGVPVHFMDDGSYDPDGGLITKYEWDWENDGVYDEEGSDLHHEWAEPGTYYVQFRVTDDESSTDELDAPLKVQISNDFFDPIPIADFNPYPQTVCEPVGFFDDGSYDPDGGSIIAYEWDWENDGVFDEINQMTEHTWNEVGVYYVQFRVTDDEGVSSMLSEPLEVLIENALPVAVAYVDNPHPMVDEAVNLFGFDSYDGDCGGAAITNWEWDIDGDGNFDTTGETVPVSWGTAGIYHVMLRVTDDESGTDTLDTPLEITVVGAPPVAIATADPMVAEIGQNIHFFDDGSYDPDGGIITKYEWDWDDDGTWDVEGNEAYHSWPSHGERLVQFRVTDDESDTDTLDDPMTIMVHALPVAQACCSPISTTLSDIATPMYFADNGSYDPDGGSIVKWEWDVGCDGIYEFEGNPYDVELWYPAAGTYYFQCRVTDDEGGTDTLDTPLWIEVLDYGGWARTWGASAYDSVQAVDLDAQGNIYAAGMFNGTVDFDPGPGVDEHISNGSYDCFVVKYDPSGAFQWARTWGNDADTASDLVFGIAVDPNGNSFVTGCFTGTVDFDPGPGIDNRASAGSADGYLLKLDSNGNETWVQTWGGTTYDFGRCICLMTDGGVAVGGYFTGTVDLDPGPGTDSHTEVGGWGDVFISRFNENGGYTWGRTWGSDYEDRVNAVAADSSNSVYSVGWYEHDTDFDPSPGGSDVHTGPACFLSRLASDGSYYWARTWGGVSENATDAVIYSGLVFVAGYFEGIVDFDPDPLGSDFKTSAGARDSYVNLFDSLGAQIGSLSFGGTGYDVALSIDTDDTLGSLLIAGTFSETCNFDAYGGVHNVAAIGNSDSYLCRFSPGGGYLEYVRQWGCVGKDQGAQVVEVFEPTGNVFMAGDFQGTVDFDPGIDVDNHTEAGGQDAFLMKLQPNGLY